MLMKYLPVIPTLIMIALMMGNIPSVIGDEHEKHELKKHEMQKDVEGTLVAQTNGAHRINGFLKFA